MPVFSRSACEALEIRACVMFCVSCLHVSRVFRVFSCLLCPVIVSSCLTLVAFCVHAFIVLFSSLVQIMSKLVAFVKDFEAAGFSREDAMREWERELEEKRQQRELEEKRQQRELEEKRQQLEEKRQQLEEKRQQRIMELLKNNSLPADQRAQLVAALVAPGEGLCMTIVLLFLVVLAHPSHFVFCWGQESWAAMEVMVAVLVTKVTCFEMCSETVHMFNCDNMFPPWCDA
jgi:Sec-independent protein translocase protein TatA